MVPDEIHAVTASSAKFKYSHPLSHVPVDDGSLRARLAYDLMEFMNRPDCHYYINPENTLSYAPEDSADEVDILIVDGFYKEAALLIEARLQANPKDKRSLFQKAFIKHLSDEYEKLLEREEKILRSDPKNVNALINKGVALANLSREEEALAVSDKILEIDPDNMTALSNKAYIAKILCRDDLRENTLKLAYNVSARNREKELQKLESKLLRDFESAFMMSSDFSTPSAFEAFNRKSGATVH